MEAICKFVFANGGWWRLQFRIQANDPVILVDEEFDVGGSSSLDLKLGEKFSPDTLYFRYGKDVDPERRIGRLATWEIPRGHDSPIFVLEPWFHWWQRERQGNWFALYNSSRPDLLGIAALAPSHWVEPGRLVQYSAAQTFVTSDRAGLKWSLPLKTGTRKWLITALDKDQSLKPLYSNNLYQAPLPQQYHIKYGDFPLDRVKDYVLQWKGDDQVGHPRLLVTKRDIGEFCSGFRPDTKKLKLYRKQPVSPANMDGPFNYAVCTRDSVLIRHLAETAVSWLQDAVDMFVQQTAQPTLGFAPHRQTQLITAVNLADMIWSATELSAALRNRLKAQIAFLRYVVNRDDYWSPPRGFFANPNMTTTVAAYRVMLGAMISSHPMAATWAHNGLGELKRQLKEWSDNNGGWLEAPHYAMVSYDYLLGSFLAARNAGFGDDVFDERMKKIAEWFAKICTPPDPDLADHRHLPPIGNTYIREPTGEFGLLASLWKARDPSFARKMRWMDIQQGSPIEPVIGGFLPMFAGVRSILKGREIQPNPPSFASEVFPQTGIVLRSHFPSDRETQLYLIAGNNHQHYDQDSGSITIWGKGRLIADDFGYEGYMPADDHSMVVSDQAPGEAIMHIKAHTLGPRSIMLREKKGVGRDRSYSSKTPIRLDRIIS